MAKMQRWRRRGDAGEGASSTVATPADDTAPPGDPAETLGPDDVEGLVEEPAEPTGEPGEAVEVVQEDEAADEADDVADSDGDVEDESDVESDVEADDAAVDAAVDESDVEADDEADDEAPTPLPRADQGSALSRALLGGRLPAEVVWIQLLQAAHAKQAVTTALAMALAAALSGRAPRETGVVFATVLVGQTILGWHNDIVDRQRDRTHGLTAKPIAMGRLAAGTAWYAIVVAALLLVPLAVTTGIRAGCIYLAAVAVGMLGNVVLRRGLLSWWSWAASFALLPAYLSYGGWGGQAVGDPPETSIVALAAVLGVGVHFMRSVWGLVADHEDGWTYLPLRLGLRIGATRLLALSTVVTVATVVAIAVTGTRVGLRA